MLSRIDRDRRLIDEARPAGSRPDEPFGSVYCLGQVEAKPDPHPNAHPHRHLDKPGLPRHR
ncbi:hypothetical protein D779_3045 [Imhoffiella purpurea]|uniref:Uncharacterized protein n=1 Tax=Imhoffiella purpurea TaxID=1249627 RepID=W9V3I8_9GAMM|nr:hypothetical protein D779_3045 [Imhoffiella purpurea]